MGSDKSKLSAKHQRFAEEYIIDLNATKAAERSGYSAKTAGVQGHALAVAVCNAGGLGSLPCATLSAQAMREELAAVTHVGREVEALDCRRKPRCRLELVRRIAIFDQPHIGMCGDERSAEADWRIGR